MDGSLRASREDRPALLVFPYVQRPRPDEVPADQVEAEKEIYREQMKDKPENVIEKIIGGKLDKFYSTVALLEQGFVKDPDQTVKQLIEAKGKELGGDITVSRFERFAIGEEG